MSWERSDWQIHTRFAPMVQSSGNIHIHLHPVLVTATGTWCYLDLQGSQEETSGPKKIKHSRNQGDICVSASLRAYGARKRCSNLLSSCNEPPPICLSRAWKDIQGTENGVVWINRDAWRGRCRTLPSGPWCRSSKYLRFSSSDVGA